jgi:hypothetical protein
LGDWVLVEQATGFSRGQQRPDAGHLLSITELPILGDTANGGECPYQPPFEASEQSLQRFVALLSTRVTLFLVLADRPILKAP